MHFFLFTKRPVAVGVAGGHDVFCSYISWVLAILLNPFCNPPRMVFYLILGHVSLVIYSVTHGSEEPAGEAGGRRGTRTLAH
jgi:hypothetical protein